MQEKERNLFLKYLSECENEESKSYILELFRDDANLKAIENIARDEWNNESNSTRKDLRHILHKIHFIINSDLNNTRQPLRLTLTKWLVRVAAILLIPVLSVLIYTKSPSHDVAYAELQAPFGARVNFTLPDGSSGWLNGGSTLKYQLPFNERNVSITGEVYLNVKKDAGKTFSVSAGSETIEVLGTRFNINAWPGEKITEVVLEEGLVKFYTPCISQGIEIQPGEMLTYNHDNQIIEKKYVRTNNYTSWINGKLTIRGETMETLSRKLEQWYNIKVEVQDEKLNQYTFRATFEDEKLEDVLRLLKLTSPIEYQIIDNDQKTNGVFEKKRVIFTYKNK